VNMITETSDKSQRESQRARESSGTAEGSLTVSPAETTTGALLAPLQLVLHQQVAVAMSRAKQGDHIISARCKYDYHFVVSGPGMAFRSPSRCTEDDTNSFGLR